MDIYVVIDWGINQLVGASAKLQGAELMRGIWAGKCADTNVGLRSDDPAEWDRYYRRVYDRTQVINRDLADMED